MPDPSPLSIEDAVALVAASFASARLAFTAGLPVHITFSPGDGTAYAMTFVPPGGIFVGSPGEYCRIPDGAGLLVLPAHRKACPINPQGSPDAGYVAEKLGPADPQLILAVGIVWGFMVGGSPEQLAERWGAWIAHVGDPAAAALAEWDRDRLRPGVEHIV